MWRKHPILAASLVSQTSFSANFRGILPIFRLVRLKNQFYIGIAEKPACTSWFKMFYSASYSLVILLVQKWLTSSCKMLDFLGPFQNGGQFSGIKLISYSFLFTVLCCKLLQGQSRLRCRFLWRARENDDREWNVWYTDMTVLSDISCSWTVVLFFRASWTKDLLSREK